MWQRKWQGHFRRESKSIYTSKARESMVGGCDLWEEVSVEVAGGWGRRAWPLNKLLKIIGNVNKLKYHIYVSDAMCKIIILTWLKYVCSIRLLLSVSLVRVCPVLSSSKSGASSGIFCFLFASISPCGCYCVRIRSECRGIFSPF